MPVSGVFRLWEASVVELIELYLEFSLSQINASLVMDAEEIMIEIN